jgi:hypothetical protein
MPAPKWIPIFKTGQHTDSKGKVANFDAAYLDRIIATYNPSVHEAPVVVGHPETNAPAFAWVEQLKRDGEVLFYTEKDPYPDFVEMRKKGLFKKRSISLYADGTLRHVGWLGAMPPAVKGLADVQFAADDGKLMTFEFCDEDSRKLTTVGRIMSSMRDFLIEKFGLEVVDKIIPSYLIEYLVQQPADELQPFAEEDPAKKAQAARAKKYAIAVQDGGNVTKPAEFESLTDAQFADPVNYRYPIDADHVQAALSYWGKPDNRSAYSAAEVKVITKRILAAAKANDIQVDESKWEFNEPSTINHEEEDMNEIEKLKQQITDLQKQISTFSETDKAKEAELARLKGDLAAREKAERLTAHNNFCEKLVSKGTLAPVHKPVIIDLMEILSFAGKYEFAEADGKKVEKAPLDVFKGMLEALPKVVEFGEHATRDAASTGDAASQDFAIDGKSDEASRELRIAAETLAKKENISFVEAVRRVQAAPAK